MSASVLPIRPGVMARIMGDPAAAGLRRVGGYGAAYRVGQAVVPACPGCGMSSWLVGRVTVECGRCGTALPLTD